MSPRAYQKSQKYVVTQVPLKCMEKGDTKGDTQGEYLSGLKGCRVGKMQNAMAIHPIL